MTIGQLFTRAGETYVLLREFPSGTLEARRASTGEFCRLLSAAQEERQEKRKMQQEQDWKNRREQAALKREIELARSRMDDLRIREESEQLIDRTPALRQLRDEYTHKRQNQEHDPDEEV